MFGRRVFGRKGSDNPVEAPAERKPENPGHAHVLDLLRREETEKPLQRQQVAGHIIFDLVYRLAADERGCRIEDLIAILASTGGHSCTLAAIAEHEAAPGSGHEHDFLVVKAKDGQKYIFGNIANRYLFESEHAMLSIAMGTAQQLGASLSIDDVHDAMRHVAGSIGGEAFGVPRLPEAHMPRDRVINYAAYLWPKVQEALDLYEVDPLKRPMAIGFALAEAIDKGQQALDLRLMALIAIECAIPIAKVTPKMLEEIRAG
jgi:hypothetical protein